MNCRLVSPIQIRIKRDQEEEEEEEEEKQQGEASEESCKKQQSEKGEVFHKINHQCCWKSTSSIRQRTITATETAFAISIEVRGSSNSKSNRRITIVFVTAANIMMIDNMAMIDFDDDWWQWWFGYRTVKFTLWDPGLFMVVLLLFLLIMPITITWCCCYWCFWWQWQWRWQWFISLHPNL